MRIVALGAVGAAIGGLLRSRREPPAVAPRSPGRAEWPPLTLASSEPVSSRSVAEDSSDAIAPWVDAIDGSCPVTHPVKGNASSGIYHLPGTRFYDMTIPERCYRDADAAQADGMRAPKR